MGLVRAGRGGAGRRPARHAAGWLAAGLQPAGSVPPGSAHLPARTGRSRHRRRPVTHAGVTGAPPVREEERRVRQLRIMRRRATGLLVLTAIAFLVIVLVGDDKGGW